MAGVRQPTQPCITSASTENVALPQNLVGLTNTVWTRSGKSLDATITEVVERSSNRILVRTRRLDQ